MTDASSTPTEPPAGQNPAVSGTAAAPSTPLTSRPLGTPAQPTSAEPADVTRTLTPGSYTHLRAHETNRLISYAVFCL